MAKKTTKQQGIEILKRTVRTTERHKDYNRTVEIAKAYTAYVTGEGVGDLLKQFNPRESDELFNQRVALTSLTTPDIANTLITPMYKVGRTTPNSSFVWSEKEKATQNRKALTDIANSFHGNESVTDYLTLRMVELDHTDPNSFIVVEFDGLVDPNDKTSQKAEPYPFEVSSEEAINYRYLNKRLQWLVVYNKHREHFTIYLENESVTAVLVTKEQRTAILSNYKNAVFFNKDEKDPSSPIYFMQEFSHKADRIPAMRVGTKRDLTTRGRTCVPMIHPAKSYFEKAIKTISEFDLTMALHTFPKVFRYGEVCQGDMKNGEICNKGMCGETKCKHCKGTGYTNQTSTANEIIVKYPKDPKDLVSLENMMTYKAPPAELLEFQKKLGLYELKECAIRAMYPGDTFSKNTVATTATEEMINFESVYDTLKPFGGTWSAMYIHIMSCIASYRDLGRDLTITHDFPKDLKMKSVEMLLADLKLASDSGAASYVKKSIGHDIAKKIYVDQPDELLRLQVKETFYPFNGKSETEVNYILANDVCTRFDKVLYAKFDNIFSEIELEQPEGVSFYDVEYTKQKELIKAKVSAYLAELDAQEAASRATSFGKAEDIEQPGDPAEQEEGQEEEEEEDESDDMGGE
ncbi:MAG: hypothetical protein M3R27_08905 [Bacteroidota bacterium]|nr:hypothetical protein [Bacteroidota bacterium]